MGGRKLELGGGRGRRGRRGRWRGRLWWWERREAFFWLGVWGTGRGDICWCYGVAVPGAVAVGAVAVAGLRGGFGGEELRIKTVDGDMEVDICIPMDTSLLLLLLLDLLRSAIYVT